jgi:general secretion pathway protein E
LQNVAEPHRALHAAMLSRIKIMANLDIAEKRLPQDGRISLRLAGRQVDVRVATLPTGFGERAVLRLLDKEGGKLQLTSLGMEGATLAKVDELIHQPHGIVLVTGPTGSGKTTTLYAALSRIDSRGLNIMTVEDPIEYELDGVSQTHVNAKIDMTFARALRSILRHDPDVIMIGEIRDLETAQIAVQASLTGHLVLATLHTNDAVSATTRLVDMGVEPYLLSSSLLGVLAQRLVRKLCPECKVRYEPTPVDIAEFGGRYTGGKLFGPGGCQACAGTGYAGRTGIYELMVVDQEAKRLIHEAASEQLLRAHVVKQGMRGLRQDGLRWVLDGATSLEEVVRVTRET